MEKIVATRQEKPNKNEIKNQNIVSLTTASNAGKDGSTYNSKNKDKKNKFCPDLKKLFCKNRNKNSGLEGGEQKNDNKQKKHIDNKKDITTKKPLKNKKEQINSQKNKGEQNQNSKSSKLKIFLKKHGKFIGIIVGFFVLFLTVLLLAFANSQYYDFINRPKVLQYSSVLIVMLLASGAICLVEFFVNLLLLEKTNKNSQKQKSIKNNKKSVIIKKYICNLKILNKSPKSLQISKLKCQKKARQIKFAYKKPKRPASKFDILKLNIYIVLMLLVLCLSFKIKVLWMCVLSSFAVCVLNVNLLVCNKTKQSRVLNSIMLLVNICNFFSFYLIYLLN